MIKVQTLTEFIGIDENNPDETLDEKLVRKKVIRNGKLKVIKRTNRAGFKSTGGKKEVKMTAKEKINRMKSQKIGKLKRKAKTNQANRKRKLSMKKRGNLK